MANEFIGRKSAIWLWLEATRWTAVQPQVWIPKQSGVLNPSIESVNDDSWYGVIDEVYESFVTKAKSEISLGGIVRDSFIGYLLLGALWKCTPVNCYTGTASWWTPKRWEGSANNKIKKIVKKWTTTYYYIDWSAITSLTNGTWTLTLTKVSWVYWYMFERLNNNTHPSFTLFDDDPVSASYAAYSMISTFEISCNVADYVKFSAAFEGKGVKPVEWALSPAYADENPFTASMAGVRFAANEAWLNDAEELCMQSFRVSVNKNLADVQCFGSTDIDAIYNQQFTVEGDFTALYNSVALRDYVLDTTKKAVRFYAENSNVPALATGIYPAIYVDVMKAWFTSWSKSDTANEIINQTIAFNAEYDNATWASIEVLLVNWNWNWYEA